MNPVSDGLFIKTKINPELDEKLYNIYQKIAYQPIETRTIPRQTVMSMFGVFASDEMFDRFLVLFGSAPFYFTVVDL